jgi:hypothetical protein
MVIIINLLKSHKEKEAIQQNDYRKIQPQIIYMRALGTYIGLCYADIYRATSFLPFRNGNGKKDLAESVFSNN